MFDVIVEITKVYLGIVAMLILIDVVSFLLAHWQIVLAITFILALLIALFLLVLPIIILVKIVKFIF